MLSVAAWRHAAPPLLQLCARVLSCRPRHADLACSCIARFSARHGVRASFRSLHFHHRPRPRSLSTFCSRKTCALPLARCLHRRRAGYPSRSSEERLRREQHMSACRLAAFGRSHSRAAPADLSSGPVNLLLWLRPSQMPASVWLCVPWASQDASQLRPGRVWTAADFNCAASSTCMVYGDIPGALNPFVVTLALRCPLRYVTCIAGV